MRDESVTPAEIEEYESLVELIRLPGWKVFKNLLHKHHLHCVDKSNNHLEKHEDREAGEWLARSKESNKILNLVETRRRELSNKIEKQKGV